MPLLPRRHGQTPGRLVVHEGQLTGGLPYLAVGQGPPLVVLSAFTAEHANPTGAARRFSLQPLRPLTQRFTVYLVNRKPGLPAGSTIKELAGHYAHALEQAFTGPVAIMGVSTGGSIAQQLAIDHPQLVGQLVLVASACRLAPAGRRMQRDLARYTRAGRPRRAWAATGPGLATTAVGGRLYAALLWLFGPRMNPKDPADMLIVVDAEDHFDAAGQLHHISAPTLLVAGDRDRYYSPELFWETAERIPNVRVRLYRGKGHASIAALTYKPAVHEILEFLTADEPAAATSLSREGAREHRGPAGKLRPMSPARQPTSPGRRSRFQLTASSPAAAWCTGDAVRAGHRNVASSLSDRQAVPAAPPGGLWNGGPAALPGSVIPREAEGADGAQGP